jgi:predicted alpha/beta hydrolase
VANDIGAAITHVRKMTGSGPVDLIRASFGGGISAFFTPRHPGQATTEGAGRGYRRAAGGQYRDFRHLHRPG